MSTVRDPQRDQPLPTPGRQPVQDILIAAIADRRAYGTRKYGRPLETHNGRDALTDAWEEALDLVTYLTQARLERGDQITTQPPQGDAPTARQSHRAAAHDLIARVGRGRAGADVATLLAGHLDAEQADGDAERNTHEAHRLALARTLKWDEECTWDDLLQSVTATERDATRAEQRVTNLRTALAEVLAVGPGLSDDDLIACVRDILGKRDRASFAMRTHKRALLTILGMDPTRDWDDISNAVCGIVKARQAAEQRNADNWDRAEKADVEVKRLGLMVDEYGAGARHLSDKLRDARTTLDAVRAIAEPATQYDDIPQDHLAQQILTALGDPQPATKPEPNLGGPLGLRTRLIPGAGWIWQCYRCGIQASEHYTDENIAAEYGDKHQCRAPEQATISGSSEPAEPEQPTESGKSEYRRNAEREAKQHVVVYGISINEWDRLWLTVQSIADAAGVKPAFGNSEGTGRPISPAVSDAASGAGGGVR